MSRDRLLIGSRNASTSVPASLQSMRQERSKFVYEVGLVIGARSTSLIDMGGILGIYVIITFFIESFILCSYFFLR